MKQRVEQNVEYICDTTQIVNESKLMVITVCVHSSGFIMIFCFDDGVKTSSILKAG